MPVEAGVDLGEVMSRVQDLERVWDDEHAGSAEWQAKIRPAMMKLRDELNAVLDSPPPPKTEETISGKIWRGDGWMVWRDPDWQ